MRVLSGLNFTMFMPASLDYPDVTTAVALSNVSTSKAYGETVNKVLDVSSSKFDGLSFNTHLL